MPSGKWFYGSDTFGIVTEQEFSSQSNKASYALLAELGIRAHMALLKENQYQ